MIFVVDMANFQGVPDMVKARDEGGVRAAILKLTEGTYYTNELFDAQAAACDRAGIPWAVYGYNGNKYVGVDYRKSGRAEAGYLLAQGVARWGNRPIFLDLEDATGPVPQPDYALEWEATILAGGGRFAGIYSYTNFIQVNLQDQRLASRPLWLANYPNQMPTPTTPWPVAPPPWSAYRLWQFSGGMFVPGIGNVDGNYFDGTAEEFANLGNATQPAPTNPDALVARSYLSPEGQPITEIRWGGQMTAILGTSYVDIGIRGENAKGEVFHRSILDGQAQEYVKE